MSSIEKINRSLEEYVKVTDKTHRNRNEWMASLKQMIHDIFTQIVSKKNLNWTVIKIEGITNLEAVRLQLNPEPSGITVKSNVEVRDLLKHRGALVLAQAFNGDIIVIHEYPYIEDLMKKPDDKVIDTIDPDDISEEYILKQIESFLSDIIEWEQNSEHRNTIGFKLQMDHPEL